MKPLCGQHAGRIFWSGKVKKNLQVFIEPPAVAMKLDHVLLYGPPGWAKQHWPALSPTNWVSISDHNRSGTRNRATCGDFNQSDRSGCLFIDEIHRLNRSVEEILYPAMEDYALDIMIGKGPSAFHSLDLPSLP